MWTEEIDVPVPEDDGFKRMAYETIQNANAQTNTDDLGFSVVLNSEGETEEPTANVFENQY